MVYFSWLIKNEGIGVVFNHYLKSTFSWNSLLTMINFKTVFLLKEWPKCASNKFPGQSVTENQVLGVVKLWALNTWTLNHIHFVLISTMVLKPVCTLDSPGSLIKMVLPAPHSQSLCLWFKWSSWALDIFFFFFKDSFRFIAILTRGFPFTPYPHICTASPLSTSPTRMSLQWDVIITQSPCVP